jgi:hypothetical protein
MELKHILKPKAKKDFQRRPPTLSYYLRCAIHTRQKQKHEKKLYAQFLH